MKSGSAPWVHPAAGPPREVVDIWAFRPSLRLGGLCCRAPRLACRKRSIDRTTVLHRDRKLDRDVIFVRICLKFRLFDDAVKCATGALASRRIADT
jgi:hypothetical protein